MQMDAPPLSEEELNSIYTWIDGIPLTRAKRNITRDFADGCMLAEIIGHYLPRHIEVHNYSLAHSQQQKLYNWNTLNEKVFKKMGFQISKVDIDHVIKATPDAVERVLKVVQIKLERFLEEVKKQKDQQPSYIDQSSPRQQQGGNRKQQGQNAGSQNPYQFVEYMNPKEVTNLLYQRDSQISELRETVEILELKIKKMDQLIKLKDSKIQNLVNKLSTSGMQ